MLYQALTGKLPFVGSAAEVIARKWTEAPPPLLESAPRAPSDLSELCAALLRIDPAERPEGDEILALLGGVPRPSPRAPVRADAFVGRLDELGVMERAFERACAGATVTLLVEGESGVGKSALMRELTGRLAARAGALLLRGRCYERESLPYKAIDSLMDQLARYLASLPAPQCAALLPESAATLRSTFPVLEIVPSLLALPSVPIVADPHEARARMFASVRALFINVSRVSRIVMSIDDLQWADEDSLMLLTEVLRQGGPSLLLLGSIRSASERGQDARGRTDALLAHLSEEVQRMRLDPLPEGDARALIRRLLEEGEDPSIAEGVVEGVIDGIRAEAKGHPLFIDELVRHRAAHEAVVPARLDDALWERASRLPADARTLLEVVAVAGAPTPQQVVAKAAALDFARAFDSIAALRAGRLVLTSGAYRHDTVEPYHDRVRESVLMHLEPAVRKEWHGRLALALEQSKRPDPEKLIQHWLGAGEPARAGEYAVRAADAAVKALAFEHASSLYRTAIELHPHDPEAERELYRKLGDALVASGRGVAAAKAFQSAASGAPVGTALVLRRRATEQLLRAGEIEEGLTAVRQLLAQVGMRLPKSPITGIVYLLVWRAFLWLRGLRFVERDVSTIPVRDLERLDVCWTISSALGVVDTFRAAAFQARHLALALRAGEPFRVARALAVESVYVGLGGEKTWKKAEICMARADAIAERTGRSDAVALALFTRALVHHVAGRFRAAASLFERAQPLLRAEPSGMHWEIGTSQAYMLTDLAFCGELAKLCELQPAYLRDATERGDLHAAFNLRTGHRALPHLIRDDPDRVHADVREAMRAWSTGGYHMKHLDANIATVNAQLYAGDGRAAYETMRASWPRLVRSLLLQIQLVRVWSHWDRARSAIAAAQAGARPTGALLRIAARDARALEREGCGWSIALSKLVAAGVANVRAPGEPGGRALLERGIGDCDALGMRLHAASARRALGALVGGDEGRALVRAAEQWMVGQGVRKPTRMAQMIVPGV